MPGGCLASSHRPHAHMQQHCGLLGLIDRYVLYLQLHDYTVSLSVLPSIVRDIRNKYFVFFTMKDVFEKVTMRNIINFFKETYFYNLL